MSTAEQTALTWSMGMAGLGYSVVPCRIVLRRTTSGRLTKVPIGMPDGWQRLAARTPEEIRSVWGQLVDRGMSPTGYMISCGPSGITVPDLDVGPLSNGVAGWYASGAPSGAFVVRTQGGGEHHYFAGRGAGCAKMGGIGDIKGVGGGVFGPGSFVLAEDGVSIAGSYTAFGPAPRRDQLTPEPSDALARLAVRGHIAARPRTDEERFWREGAPMTASVALRTANAKLADVVDRFADGRWAAGARGFRAAIATGAAYYLGGLIHSGHLPGITVDTVHDQLEAVVTRVFPSGPDDEDRKHIEQGVADGMAAPLRVAPDPGAPAPHDAVPAASSDAVAELGTSTGFDFAFLDPDVDPEPPEPARYGGFGGAPLFYADGVHWLQGESESGKSMVALAGPVLDAVRAGGLVLYVDHEDTRARVQERLQQLGVTREELRRVCYVPAVDVAHGDIVAHLRTSGRDYAVMVIDGVTSALSSAGLSGRDEQEVTRWVDDLPRRARMAVCIDHVVKAQDSRAGMAIGSQAKKAVVTGTAWEVECVEKFGRGTSGQIVLSIQKDKPGWVRGAGVGRVRLHVASAPGTYALSVRVAGGSVADPFDTWVLEQLRQGQRWYSQNSLQHDAKAAGQGYRRTRMRERFERYEELTREYESISPSSQERESISSLEALWGGSQDQQARVVPRTGSMGTGSLQKPTTPAQIPVPTDGNPPGTTGTGSRFPTLWEGTEGTGEPQNNGHSPFGIGGPT